VRLGDGESLLLSGLLQAQQTSAGALSPLPLLAGGKSNGDLRELLVVATARLARGPAASTRDRLPLTLPTDANGTAATAQAAHLPAPDGTSN
jgi:Flp pilus assembly secretin CpaC